MSDSLDKWLHLVRAYFKYCAKNHPLPLPPGHFSAIRLRR